MMQDIKPYSLESSAFYRSIIKVDFKPIEKVTSIYHKPYHKKGDVIYKRNLLTGFRKKVKKVFTEDVWMDTSYGEFYGWLNIHQWAEKYGFLVIDGELYRKPCIQIETTNKDNNRTIKFESNDDATKYMRDLKEKCKLCKNNLL